MSLSNGNDCAFVTSTDLEHSTIHDIIKFELIEINVWDVNARKFHLISTQRNCRKHYPSASCPYIDTTRTER